MTRLVSMGGSGDVVVGGVGVEFSEPPASAEGSVGTGIGGAEGV
jgi:hypothetical protein